MQGPTVSLQIEIKDPAVHTILSFMRGEFSHLSGAQQTHLLRGAARLLELADLGGIDGVGTFIPRPLVTGSLDLSEPLSVGQVHPCTHAALDAA